MRAAFQRVDIVGKRQKRLVVRIGILQRHLRDGAGGFAVHIRGLFGAHINHFGVDELAVLLLVDVRDKRPDAALVFQPLVFDILRVALVGDGDVHPGVEKRLLAQSFQERVIVKHHFVENLRVGLEADVQPVFFGRTLIPERPRHRAALKALGISSAAIAALDFNPFGKRVYHRGADAVKPARKLVSVAVKLAAGMQYGENDLQRGNPHFRVNPAGDTLPVVLHRNRPVGQQRHVNLLTSARQRLVNGVIHNFVHQVMKPAERGGADIHDRAAAHRFQPVQHLYLAVVINLSCFFVVCHVSSFLFAVSSV